MTLHCTLVRGPGAVRSDAAVELTVRVRPGCPGTELDRAVSGAFGTRELTVNGLPLDTMTVGEVPLVNGAVLVDGGGRRARPRARPAADASAALLLAVHSGPGAGTVLPLRRGSYRIGRTNAELTIPDPDLSREHAKIEVSDTAMTILDLDSVNGTEVDGKRVRNAVISTSSLIRCGNSTLSVLVAGPPGRKSVLPGLRRAVRRGAPEDSACRRAGRPGRASCSAPCCLSLSGWGWRWRPGCGCFWRLLPCRQWR